MILNAYAVLDGFLVLLRLGFGLLVVGLAVGAWRRAGADLPAEEKKLLEDRCYLVYLLAVVLVGLNVVSWPLFYLLLQSYVPQWPEVMCVYGVTKIGTGSLGPSRFLPGLVTAVQGLKPVLVFVGGAWLVLYLLDRRTQTGPLTRRLLAVVTALGLLAAADSAAEAAYLVIPKKEERVSTGCCMEAFDSADGTSRFLPRSLFDNGDQSRILTVAYIAVNAWMVLGLAGSLWLLLRRQRVTGLVPLVLGALVSLPISGLYLVEKAAPVLLGLPDHHCPYDLIPDAPEAVVAVGLYFLGAFAVGWAGVVRWCANTPETRPFLLSQVRTLLGIGLFGYLSSVLMLAHEVAWAAARTN